MRCGWTLTSRAEEDSLGCARTSPSSCRRRIPSSSACAVLRERTNWSSSSPIPVGKTSGGGRRRSSILDVKLARWFSRAARSNLPGDRPVAAPCVISDRSNSSSAPAPAGRERSGWRISILWTARSAGRRWSPHRAERGAAIRRPSSTTGRTADGEVRSVMNCLGCSWISTRPGNMAAWWWTGRRCRNRGALRSRPRTTANRGGCCIVHVARKDRAALSISRRENRGCFAWYLMAPPRSGASRCSLIIFPGRWSISFMRSRRGVRAGGTRAGSCASKATGLARACRKGGRARSSTRKGWLSRTSAPFPWSLSCMRMASCLPGRTRSVPFGWKRMDWPSLPPRGNCPASRWRPRPSPRVVTRMRCCLSDTASATPDGGRPT